MFVTDTSPRIESANLETPSAINPADIRLAAMNLLARREHSLHELRHKLRRRFPDQQLLELELQKLADENLQSDDRFTESFVRQRSGRGYGPVRIRQELREKGVSDSALTMAFEQTEVDWYAVAEMVYTKKFGREKPLIGFESGMAGEGIKEKSRRARFMQYRGFSPEHYRHLFEG